MGIFIDRSVEARMTLAEWNNANSPGSVGITPGAFPNQTYPNRLVEGTPTFPNTENWHEIGFYDQAAGELRSYSETPWGTKSPHGLKLIDQAGTERRIGIYEDERCVYGPFTLCTSTNSGLGATSSGTKGFYYPITKSGVWVVYTRTFAYNNTNQGKYPTPVTRYDGKKYYLKLLPGMYLHFVCSGYTSSFQAGGNTAESAGYITLSVGPGSSTYNTNEPWYSNQIGGKSISYDASGGLLQYAQATFSIIYIGRRNNDIQNYLPGNGITAATEVDLTNYGTDAKNIIKKKNYFMTGIR